MREISAAHGEMVFRIRLTEAPINSSEVRGCTVPYS